LKSTFDLDVRLIPSGGGVFEVEANGKPLFSKKRLGRFPEDGEIEKLLRTMMS